MRTLTHRDQFKCPCGFPIELNSPGAESGKLMAKGEALLVEDIQNAKVQGCQKRPPCTTVIMAKPGSFQPVKIGGKVVLAEDAEIQTINGKVQITLADSGPGHVKKGAAAAHAGTTSQSTTPQAGAEANSTAAPAEEQELDQLDLGLVGFFHQGTEEWAASPLAEFMEELCDYHDQVEPGAAEAPPNEARAIEVRQDPRSTAAFEQVREQARLWLSFEMPLRNGQVTRTNAVVVESDASPWHLRFRKGSPGKEFTIPQKHEATHRDGPTTIYFEAKAEPEPVHSGPPKLTAKGNIHWRKDQEDVVLTVTLLHGGFLDWNVYLLGNTFALYEREKQGLADLGWHLAEEVELTFGMRSTLEVRLRGRKIQGKAKIKHEDPRLELVLRTLKSAGEKFAEGVIKTHEVRKKYLEALDQFRREVRRLVRTGEWSRHRAVIESNRLRLTMQESEEFLASPLAETIARRLRRTIPLGQRLAGIADKMYGPLKKLTAADKISVYDKFIFGLNHTRPWIDKTLDHAAVLAHVVDKVTKAVTVWKILTAENKMREAGREGAKFLGDKAGGFLFGAAAVAVGVTGWPVALVAFVGMAVGSEAAEAGFDWFVEKDDELNLELKSLK